MLSYNRNQNPKAKSSVKNHKGAWAYLFFMACLSMYISFFGFAGAAQAADISLTNPGTGSGDVRYSVNGGGWTNLTLTAGLSVPITVPDGSNVDFDLVNADPSSSFVGWTGDGAPGAAPIDWTLNAVSGSYAVNGTFELKKLTVTVNSPGAGSGGVTDKDGPNTVNYGASITITPTPDAGYQFKEWTGSYTGTDNPLTITNVTSDMTINATFHRTYTLTIQKAGSGAGLSTVDPAPGIHVYDEGTVVGLTATDTRPAAGALFMQWACDAGCGTSVLANPADPDNATITVNEDTTVTATFLTSYQITLRNPGTGSGTVRHDNGAVFVDQHLAPGQAVPILVELDPFFGANRNFNLVSADPTCVFDGWGGDGESPWWGPPPDWYLDVTGGEVVDATFTQTYEISIDDPSVTEGGTAQFTVTVTPEVVAGDEVRVTYISADDTAIAAVDYTAHPSTELIFGSTESTKTINVLTLDDSLYESQERFFVNLSSPSANATITKAQGEGLIDDDADTVAISISNATAVTEGSLATFTVSLDQDVPTGQSVSVQWATSDDTATQPDDYDQVLATTLTFIGGEGLAGKTIQVQTRDDTLVENQERFFVNLSSPSANATIADGQGEGLIDDDADTYDISIQSVTPFPATEGTDNTVTFTLALLNIDPTHGIIGAIQVDYATADGSAVAGAPGSGDYDSASGTLNFLPTETTKDIAITINNDTLYEVAETFDLTIIDITGPRAGSIISGSETATITDDGDIYSVSIEPTQNVTEGAVPGTVTFTVTLDQQVPGGAEVAFATADGSAVAGAPGSGDYDSVSGTLSFGASETTQDITVTINNDTLYEMAETFDVDISTTDPNANITASKGVCTITDDADKYGVSIEAAKTVKEGAAPGTVTFTVTLDQQVPGGAEVAFTTADGSAVAGAPGSGDYDSASGTLNFLPTETTKDITVIINNDTLHEVPPETFDVDITSIDPNANVTASKGICTIDDNEYTLTLTRIGTGAGFSTASASNGDKTGLPGGPADGIFVYEEGDVVTLTAADTYPAQGSLFKGWGGDATGTDYTTNVTITGDMTVTADFNATYTFAVREAGTGIVVSTVTAGPGSQAALFPGGIADGDYLYEEGDTISLIATDTTPEAGSEFQDWTVDTGDPGAGFAPTAKSTTVTISGDLQVTGNFRGTWKVTAIARTGGQLDPLGVSTGYYGDDQPYTITANTNWSNSDVVVDHVSQGPLKTYTFSNIIGDHTIIAAFIPGSDPYIGPPAGDDQIYQAAVPPLVLMVMGRSHKLYYEAYNDASDLNGDGTLDVGYKPSIDYYGYFDSYKAYRYSSTSARFEPSSLAPDKKVNASDEWSGNFLNYLTMSRMDVMRKVLYGGYRSTDTATETVLERVFIPQDAHSWGKEYESIARDGYDIREYTPLDLPAADTRHLFASTTLSSNGDPLLRVLTNETRYNGLPRPIWEWVSIERPVAGNEVEDDLGRHSVSPTDYVVRVQVAVSGMEEENCKQYPSGVYKPIGILQKHGEAGRMYFGLLTGSYAKNTSGGILRKRIGPISDEIDPSTGQFVTPAGGSIIDTINKFRISEFRYSDHSYEPGWDGAWVTTRAMNEGEFPDWGNPVAEMMYEGLRYFAGKQAPTDDFHDATMTEDDALGLPNATWDDPYQTYDYCAKPFMLVLSDINPTYDSDQLPGSYFGAAPSPNDLSGLNVDAGGDTIFTEEGLSGSYYIGQQGSNYDGSCAPKAASGFGDIRGLCPEEPTKEGSFYAASVAHFGRTQDINPAEGEQKVLTYAVALASPLPRISIPIGNNTITLVPFAKSVGGCLGISPTSAFQPTNTIVDFYVETITPTSGTFRINFEDVEQAADHDMDAIAEYEYQVNGNTVSITLRSTYAGGCIIQHMGYIISGTTADGTYLEVRDCDTENGSCPERTSSDVDYFLDTPPGVQPGTVSDWDDDSPLPLTTTRTFTVGTTTGAKLLKNPLWYAAKWGGFNDLDDDDKPDSTPEWDEDGDSIPDTYFYVVNPLKLEHQLNQTFSNIISRGVSHVAPVASVDQANRTQSGDELYLPFFRPVPDDYWQGNLKKYGLDYLSRDECGRVDQEWTVVDKDGNIASDCDGAFKSSATSFWSALPDGGYVNRGGVGERLKDSMPGLHPIDVPPSGPYYDFRNIYTYKNGALTRFNRTNITNADLEVATDLQRYRIINYIYGYTFDADETTGDPRAKREWILGDMIHSQPRVIDYLDEIGNLARRYIAVGSNDGMLHVFTDMDIPSMGYDAGDEIFAFVPADLLPRLKEFGSADIHRYMVDGSANLFVSPTFNDANINGLRDADEYYLKTLVFSERRGGKSYWSLDVTEPDPSLWSVKWYIEGGGGGTAGFEELAYTFSKPLFTTIRTAADTVKNVVIFAGGYDTLEDGYPEGFDDTDEDGIWDFTDTNGNGAWDPGEAGETYAVTVGGTEGHDNWNPGLDTMGRGIYVVDMETGSLLFKATYGDTDVTTGTDQRYTMMKYCFPADISVIPLSVEYVLMYVADIYGQIWKITYDYLAGDPTKWAVKRIFRSNPGSDMPTGTYDPVDIAAASLNASDAGRKAFYSPDVSFGNDWAPSLPVLYFGTGDREHPRYRMISNRFYALTDTDTLADERDLLNLTCDELDRNADTDGDGDFDTDDTAIQNALANLIFDHEASGVRGFYRVLDKQGDCPDDDFDHTGEQVLSQPTLFFKNVFFTSYQAVFGDPCNPLGNAYIYALDYSWFTAALNFEEENDLVTLETRDIRDTYRVITGSSIPSGVSVITREGKAAGLTSAGGSLVGVGEEGSTSIPGPPPGVSPILWETE
jgi:hypothetical protein